MIQLIYYNSPHRCKLQNTQPHYQKLRYTEVYNEGESQMQTSNLIIIITLIMLIIIIITKLIYQEIIFSVI